MRLVLLVPVSLAIVSMGCATASLKSSQRAPENLAQPGVILVYDFAVSPAGLEGADPSDEPPSAEELELGRATAASLSLQLVDKLVKKGIRAERASDLTQPPFNALLIKGEFLDVDKGSRLKRVVIGFGAGSSKLEARVAAYQVLASGTERIAALEADSTGSKMPGMAVPVGVGAIAGNVIISAAVSGGMNLAKEARGGMSADAGRMAEKLAERIISYYERRGWL